METVPEAYWQRGYVHLLRNAPDYSPREQTDDCLTELRWVYDRHAAEEARRDRTRWLALNVVGLVAATAIAARSRCARPFYASLRRTPFSSHQQNRLFASRSGGPGGIRTHTQRIMSPLL